MYIRYIKCGTNKIKFCPAMKFCIVWGLFELFLSTDPELNIHTLHTHYNLLHKKCIVRTNVCYEGIGPTSKLQLNNTCFVTVLYNVIDFEIPIENPHIQIFIF